MMAASRAATEFERSYIEDYNSVEPRSIPTRGTAGKDGQLAIMEGSHRVMSIVDPTKRCFMDVAGQYKVTVGNVGYYLAMVLSVNAFASSLELYQGLARALISMLHCRIHNLPIVTDKLREDEEHEMRQAIFYNPIDPESPISRSAIVIFPPGAHTGLPEDHGWVWRRFEEVREWRANNTKSYFCVHVQNYRNRLVPTFQIYVMLTPNSMGDKWWCSTDIVLCIENGDVARSRVYWGKEGQDNDGLPTSLNDLSEMLAGNARLDSN